MKRVYIRKKEKGFALIMVLIVLAVVSLLGTTALSLTTGEYRSAQKDTVNQSAYYIAEAGANHMMARIRNELEENAKDYTSMALFFQDFEGSYLGKTHIFDAFEENAGEMPRAEIRVTLKETEDLYRDYTIESTGFIGTSRRSVESVITLEWTEPEASPVIDDLLYYTKEFSFGGSSINGENGTAVLDGIETHDLNGGALMGISTIYFNGPVTIDNGSASLGNKLSPGTLYIKGNLELWSGKRNVYGDVRVKGDIRLKDAIIHGNVYVDGNLELGWTPTIDKIIYYTGTLKAPASFDAALLAKCVKVASVEDWTVPVRELTLREDSWYASNGYAVKGDTAVTLPDGAKWVVDDYSYDRWPKWDINDGTYKDIILVSKGDIRINIANSFTGALIAPNGTVEITNSFDSFTGVIVSKDGIIASGGGTKINLKTLQEMFTLENMPVLFSLPGSGGSGTGGEAASGGVSFTIKSASREK